MFIMKLYLKRYKRLCAAHTQSFEWTPSKNLMILIGRNGSGKSSILEQLTPLPPPKDAFHKGGEKIFQCLHNESVYNLHSVYDRGTGHHSFIKDGVELNEGKTYSIQEELCYQEFGITRELDLILKGVTRFSKLPVDKRKKLLTRMFPLDMSYVFDVYNRSSRSLRDKAGQIREINKRLSLTDSSALPDEATLYQMSQENDRLVNRLNRLFRETNNSFKQQFRTETDAQLQLDALLGKAHRLLREYPRLKGSKSVFSREEYEREVNGHIQEYTAVQAVVDRLVEELENLQRSTAEQGGQITPAELEQLKREHNESLQLGELEMAKCLAYSGQLPVIQFNTVGDPQSTLDDVFNRWYTIATTIPENADGWMNSKDAQETKAKLAELRKRKQSISDMFTTVSRRIATLKGCEHVQCPNCQHEFRPGIDPTEQSDLESKKERMAIALDRVEQEIQKSEEYLEAFQDYSGYVFQFVQLNKDYPQFQLLWDFCSGQQLMFREPRKWTRGMLAWKDAMDAYVRGQVALTRASILEQRLAVIAEIDQDAVGYLRQRSEKLETEINTKLLWINAKRIDTQEYSDSGLRIMEFQTAVTDLVEQFAQLRTKLHHHAEWLLSQAYEAEIQETQIQLSHAKSKLQQFTDRQHEISLLESMVGEASDAHGEINLLVKALSPTSGLIGTYMMGFMQNVCGVVNAVFDSLWSYPVAVLPSKIDDDTISYKFPLSINNGAVVTDDIEFGSHSQVSVADFAFELAIRQYLGFDSWPLFLDEFGRDFDDKHRANIVPFITSFIEQGTYKQIFYISHFESIHGAFNQAEFAVLDATNCVVPTAYNKNVRIT